MTIHGSVTRLEPEHGFGFIVDDSHGDWFFVDAGVRQGGLTTLWIGERVAFRQESTPNGPRAVDIHHEQLD
jgi:cold shock CspA family protein